MLIISIVSTKGGAGKSTLNALVAGELAHQGYRTMILDADPQQTLVKWYERCAAAGTTEDALAVLPCADEDRFHHAIRTVEADFVLVDVQGAASNLLTLATLDSDLVLIPCIPSAFDAAEATKIPNFLKQTAVRGRTPVPYRLVMNSVDGIEQKSPVFRNVVYGLADTGVRLASTIILKRATYRRLAQGYGSLHKLGVIDDAVVKAVVNIRALVEEILDIVAPLDAVRQGE